MKQYDLAAYVWPAYTGTEPRTRMFWPEGNGEWETVRAMQPLRPGHAWPRKPLWGYVDEADPYVMEMEINAAADHGVNTFIYDWYWYDNRPFLEQCLNDGFLKARNNHRMKFFLMWANHTARSIWDRRTSSLLTPIWDGAVNRATFETIMQRTIETYFKHPCYYKIDGKPVYLFYDIENLIRGLGGIDNTLRTFDWFREETVKAGFPGLELHLTIRSRQYMTKKPDGETDIFTFVNSGAFDGVTQYQFVDFARIGRPYADVLEDVKREWAWIDENIKVPYYPQVSVGWDSTPRYNRLNDNICVENTPEQVKKAFELAKEYVDSHTMKAPLITVNSWNEWTEGSYLQPDDLYGYGYLEAIRDVFMK